MAPTKVLLFIADFLGSEDLSFVKIVEEFIIQIKIQSKYL